MKIASLLLLFKKKILMFIFERERERERQCKWGRGSEGGDTESEAGSGLRAVSAEPDAGLEPSNWEIMTWGDVRCLTYWTTPAPLKIASNSERYNRTAYLIVVWLSHLWLKVLSKRQGTWAVWTLLCFSSPVLPFDYTSCTMQGAYLWLATSPFH